MKPSHLILSLAGALGVLGASAACASDVEVYGALDTALTWQNRDYVDQAAASTLQMKSGQWIGSRVGIKGSERLDNGVTVGFVLENGFATDAGTLGQGGRFFGRDARVYIDGDFGFLSAGRMGSLVGGNGPYARFGHVVSPFSCGWGDIGGHLQVVSLGYEFLDNAVAYKTPTVGGFDATVQYSFGTDTTAYGTGREGTSGVDRLASGALRYQGHDLLVAFGVESINWANPGAKSNHLDDAFSWNLGGNYNAGWAKFYFYSQWFENYQSAAKTTTFHLDSGVDGWGVNVGVDVPVLGGTARLGVGYGDFEGSREKERTMKTWQTAVGYSCALSRRTTVYTGGDWIRSDYSTEHEADHPGAIENIYEFTVGLVHRF